MADIKVTITEQTNPSVTISEQQSNSVTVNTIPRTTLSSEISSNDAEIASIIAVTGSFAQTGQPASFSTLDVSGQSQFDKKVKITPNNGIALHAHSSGTNNAAVRIECEGPVLVGHDLFQKGGFTDGFADGSNHFHALIDINRIEQQPEGDVKNIERVEEKYYAIQNNNLPNSKAAFWEWHKVARTLAVSTVDTSTATLDVSLLQNSTNRSADSEAFFSLNTTPDGKSEEITITLNGHSISNGDNVRMTFDQSFEGPIVAASLFGKVASVTTNTFNVELYGGNYKTTSQVPKSTDPNGTDQTALTFDNVILESIETSTIVQNGNETNLQLYSKTNFTPNRLKDETLKATWSVAHGLVKNEHCTLITNGDGGLDILQSAYVLDPDPDEDGLSVILVYGQRVKQFDLSSFTAFGSENWTLHKGSIDGIHNETIGDNLFSFNANNVGEYNSYQIGPGSQVDADCISIGKNVYNKDASTIKIGYDNAMLDIVSTGIKVDGNISLKEGIVAPSSGSAAGSPVEGHDIKIQAGTVAGDGSTGGNLFLNGGRALQVAGQTVTNGKVSIGSEYTERLEITPNTYILGDLDVTDDVKVSGGLEIGGDLTISEKIVHIDDPNTFIRFGTNDDTFAITTSGTERLHIGPAGNVGLGANPAAVGTKNTLHINDATNGAALRLGQMQSNSDTTSSSFIRYKDSEGLQIGTLGTTNLSFETNDITAMTIDTGQNIGIGTETPDTQLHIKSTGSIALKLEADTDNVTETDNPLIQLIQDAGAISTNIGLNGNNDATFTDALENAFYIENTSSAVGYGAIQFASDDQAHLTITTGGYVGIGDNDPQAALHIKGDLRVDDTDGSPTLTYDSSANQLNTAGATFEINKSNGVDVAIGNDDFYVDMSTSSVGIGTTSPSQALDVAGNIRLASSLPKIMLVDTDSDSDFQISNTNGRFSIYDLTNNENRVIIKSDGSVGIGIDPTQKLDVAGNITATGTITSTSDVSRPIQNDEANDGSLAIRNIRRMTQEAFELITPDSRTLYVIMG